MFDHLTDTTLRAACDAARLLHDNHHELRLDPLAAIKLDTLTADITAELENRASRATQPEQSKPAPPRPAA